MNAGQLQWGGFLFYGTMNQNFVPNVGDPGIFFSAYFGYNSSAVVNELKTLYESAEATLKSVVWDGQSWIDTPVNYIDSSWAYVIRSTDVNHTVATITFDVDRSNFPLCFAYHDYSPETCFWQFEFQYPNMENPFMFDGPTPDTWIINDDSPI